MAEDNSDPMDARQVTDYRPLSRRHDAPRRRVDEFCPGFSADNPQVFTLQELLHYTPVATRPSMRDLLKSPPWNPLPTPPGSQSVKLPPIGLPSPQGHHHGVSSPVPSLVGRGCRVRHLRESDLLHRRRSDLCESCGSVSSRSSVTTFGSASSATSVRTEQAQSQDVLRTQCFSPTTDPHPLRHITEHPESDAESGFDGYYEEPKPVDSQSRRNTEPFAGSILGDNLRYPAKNGYQPWVLPERRSTADLGKSKYNHTNKGDLSIAAIDPTMTFTGGAYSDSPPSASRQRPTCTLCPRPLGQSWNPHGFTQSAISSQSSRLASGSERGDTAPPYRNDDASLPIRSAMAADDCGAAGSASIQPDDGAVEDDEACDIVSDRDAESDAESSDESQTEADDVDEVGLIQDVMSSLTTQLLACAINVIDGKAGSSAHTRCHAGGSETASSAPNSGPPESSPQRGRKRSLGGSGFSNPDDDGDNGDRNKRPRHNSNLLEVPSAKFFACPFHLHDPRKYAANPITGRKFRPCEGPGFSSIHRLKEHIHRVHCPAIQCLRCHEAFPDQAKLEAHQRAPEPCALQDRRVPEGMTTAQEQSLRKRSYPGCATEEDKWRYIYRILFPGEEPPSPYYGTLFDETTVQCRISDAIHERDARICQLMRTKVAAGPLQFFTHDILELLRQSINEVDGFSAQSRAVDFARATAGETTHGVTEQLRTPASSNQEYQSDHALPVPSNNSRDAQPRAPDIAFSHSSSPFGNQSSSHPSPFIGPGSSPNVATPLSAVPTGPPREPFLEQSSFQEYDADVAPWDEFNTAW